ncbi:MAG: hypothetical protein KDC39_12030 [Actinobacteria bacterium]|nr:hypothetical protein [Actinomycetota bacterium]
MVYGSADPGLGAISFTDADWERSSEVHVTGSARSGNDPVVAGQIRQQAREVSFGTILGRPGRVRARVVFEGGEGQEYGARIRRRLPKRTDLVISYARWKSGQPYSLVVMLRREERQRVVPVKVRVRSEGDSESATSSHNPSGRS